MRYRNFTSIAFVAAIWMAAVGDVQAQKGESAPEVDIERAVQLEQKAAVANTEQRRWSEAASLFMEAAAVRPPNDPVAFQDLRTAGAIYGTFGRLDRARATLLKLADRASLFGEIETAAHALIDVAHVSMAMGDVAATVDYYERARRLAMSSHLTTEQEWNVTRRLQGSPGLFASSQR